VPPQKFKKLRRFETPGDIRFLTFSCYQSLPLFANDAIKDNFVEVLDAVRKKMRFRLFGWVIMPNHVHLLLLPSLPDYPVAKILKTLKSAFANVVLRRWQELVAPILRRLRDSKGKLHFWQRGGGYDRNIYTEEEFLEKLQYIHDNPSRASLVEKATDWPWSSARWYEGDRAGSLLEIDPWPW
jgi:putative transposase